MNSLITTIAKERILPSSMDFFDSINEMTENQMNKMCIFLVRNIMKTFGELNILEEDDLKLEDTEKMNIALKLNFPSEWLDIAVTSPCFYLDFTKFITPYYTQLSKELINLVNKVIEFFCYEVVETMVINSSFISICEITPFWLEKGIIADETLLNIIRKQNIYLFESIPPLKIIEIEGYELSYKSHKLLRIFIEKLIKNMFKERMHLNVLSKNDVNDFFLNLK